MIITEAHLQDISPLIGYGRLNNILTKQDEVMKCLYELFHRESEAMKPVQGEIHSSI